MRFADVVCFERRAHRCVGAHMCCCGKGMFLAKRESNISTVAIIINTVAINNCHRINNNCAESAYVSIYVYIRGYVWIYVEMAPKTWMHTCVGARVLILCAREPLLSVQMSVLMHFSVQMRVLVFCLTCAMHLLLQY